MPKYKIGMKIDEGSGEPKTYYFVVEGREPYIYEEVNDLVNNLCKQLDIKEYTIYEIAETVKLGDAILLQKAMSLNNPSESFKIHYDDVVNEIGKILSDKLDLSLETIASAEMDIETEKLRVRSPCSSRS